MHLYRPSYKISLQNLQAAIFYAILIGVPLGIVFAVIARGVYSVGYSPRYVMLLGGGLLFIAIDQLAELIKFHNPALGFAAGMMVGLVAFGVYEYSQYFDFQYQVYRNLDKVYDSHQVSWGESSAAINDFLEETIGTEGFIGFIKLRFDKSASYTQANPSITRGVYFQGLNYYRVSWFLDAFLLVIFAIVPAFAWKLVASEPFCLYCNQRYSKGHKNWIGNLHASVEDEFIQLMKSGHYTAALQLFSSYKKSQPAIKVSTWRCHSCTAAETVLMLLRVDEDEKLESGSRWHLKDNQFNEFNAALQATWDKSL